ncbi:MAG TPA: hypothetical protein VJT75_04625 [Thermoleophilaceae bacterium]|nr:hypothetical protein [Thermoleophilaceae bacterium]
MWPHRQWANIHGRAMDERVDNSADDGPLWAVVAGSARITEAVARRTGVDRVLRHALLSTVDRVAGSQLAREAADRVLRSGVADEVVARLLDGPELERFVDRALESPAVERLVAHTIDSRLMDQAVAHLLDSDDLWRLVDEIARSPSVTEAIGRQSISFADQIAAAVRQRSRRADARIEHTARRLVGRDGR